MAPNLNITDCHPIRHPNIRLPVILHLNDHLNYQHHPISETEKDHLMYFQNKGRKNEVLLFMNEDLV